MLSEEYEANQSTYLLFAVGSHSLEMIQEFNDICEIDLREDMFKS